SEERISNSGSSCKTIIIRTDALGPSQLEDHRLLGDTHTGRIRSSGAPCNPASGTKNKFCTAGSAKKADARRTASGSGSGSSREGDARKIRRRDSNGCGSSKGRNSVKKQSAAGGVRRIGTH